MKAIRIIYSFFLLITLTSCGQKDKRLYCSQNANSSRGANWEYEICPDGILKEVEYYESKGFLNIGPGYSQHWVFEPIGKGEVTVSWISYKAGTSVVASECYYVIYNVDDDRNITKTFDSRDSDNSVSA